MLSCGLGPSGWCAWERGVSALREGGADVASRIGGANEPALLGPVGKPDDRHPATKRPRPKGPPQAPGHQPHQSQAPGALVWRRRQSHDTSPRWRSHLRSGVRSHVREPALLRTLGRRLPAKPKAWCRSEIDLRSSSYHAPAGPGWVGTEQPLRPETVGANPSRQSEPDVEAGIAGADGLRCERGRRFGPSGPARGRSAPVLGSRGGVTECRTPEPDPALRHLLLTGCLSKRTCCLHADESQITLQRAWQGHRGTHWASESCLSSGC